MFRVLRGARARVEPRDIALDIVGLGVPSLASALGAAPPSHQFIPERAMVVRVIVERRGARCVLARARLELRAEAAAARAPDPCARTTPAPIGGRRSARPKIEMAVGVFTGRDAS